MEDEVVNVAQKIFITAEDAGDDSVRFVETHEGATQHSLHMSTDVEDHCNIRTTTPASDFHDDSNRRNDSARFLIKVDQDGDLKVISSFTSGKIMSTEPLTGVADSYPGYGRARSFVINQLKPSPMTPLNVWRGYQGNVYFQPINIKKASLRDPDEILNLPLLSHCTEVLQNVLSRSRLNPDHLLQLRQRLENPRISARKIKRFNANMKMQLPVIHLDKDHINNLNTEYLRILECQQSFGTLRALTTLNLISKTHAASKKEQKFFLLDRRELSSRNASSRLQRGSVVRKLCNLRSSAPPTQTREINHEKTVSAKAEINNNTSSLKSSDIEMLYAKLPMLMSKVTSHNI